MEYTIQKNDPSPQTEFSIRKSSDGSVIVMARAKDRGEAGSTGVWFILITFRPDQPALLHGDLPEYLEIQLDHRRRVRLLEDGEELVCLGQEGSWR